MLLSKEEITHFQNSIFSFYERYGRSMPWRDDYSPYAVFVSEIMLQQTQVDRVRRYFHSFCRRFPHFHALAESSLADVLLHWQGLGYNRRARFMREAARMVVHDYEGILPRHTSQLICLPGIGPNTAGSIAAFAYNEPVVFIETNIRRVFIFTFFPQDNAVHDKQLLPLIQETLPHDQARKWYWALMDYGVNLKQKGREAARRSYHHVLQKPFEGSVRQLRSAVLYRLRSRYENNKGSMNTQELLDMLRTDLPNHPFTMQVLEQTLGSLLNEEFIVCENKNHYRLGE